MKSLSHLGFDRYRVVTDRQTDRNVVDSTCYSSYAGSRV